MNDFVDCSDSDEENLNDVEPIGDNAAQVVEEFKLIWNNRASNANLGRTAYTGFSERSNRRRRSEQIRITSTMSGCRTLSHYLVSDPSSSQSVVITPAKLEVVDRRCFSKAQ